jgi:hypothetical protein
MPNKKKNKNQNNNQNNNQNKNENKNLNDNIDKLLNNNENKDELINNQNNIKNKNLNNYKKLNNSDIESGSNSGYESEEEENEHIKLHKAKCITDWNARIYNSKVLNMINLGHIVRISMYISKYSKYDIYYERDAPYVEICEKNKKEFLGKILDIYRTDRDDKYPMRVGERIWFNRENIIEIPIKFQTSTRDNQSFEKYLTDDYMPFSGAIHTADLDNESTDEEYSTDTSEDLNPEVIKEFRDKRVPFIRGRSRTPHHSV